MGVDTQTGKAKKRIREAFKDVVTPKPKKTQNSPLNQLKTIEVT